MHQSIRIVGAIALLAVFVAGGFVATNAFQRKVPIAPGLDGCWRLEGSVRQVGCLSDQFIEGAREASAGLSGAARSQAVNDYVGLADVQAASDTRLGGVCHPAMHNLGRQEGASAAKAGHAPAFPDGSTQLCTAGYVHGLAEGYLSSTPDADVATVFPQLCHDASARTGCAHGIGHALLQAQPGGVVASTEAAIAGCGALPEEFPTDCHNGVYMELAMRSKPAVVPIDDYASACRAADGEDDASLGLACWGYLGLSITSNDLTAASEPKYCAQASTTGQFPCFEGYGRDIGPTKVADCATTVDGAALQQRCIDGAMGLQVGSGFVTESEARTHCTSLRTKRLRAYCDTAVTRYTSGRAKAQAADAMA